MSKLIFLGDFTLSSGLKSDFKLVADKFIEENIEGLVHLIRKIVGPYSAVEGIPRGGTLLANALREHCVDSGRYLIVDDVYTTGTSMGRAYDAYLLRTPEWVKQPWRLDQNPVGVVVFARGRPAPWVRSLLTLPAEFWPSLETRDSQWVIDNTRNVPFDGV